MSPKKKRKKKRKGKNPQCIIVLRSVKSRSHWVSLGEYQGDDGYSFAASRGCVHPLVYVPFLNLESQQYPTRPFFLMLPSPWFFHFCCPPLLLQGSSWLHWAIRIIPVSQLMAANHQPQVHLLHQVPFVVYSQVPGIRMGVQ